MAVPVVAAGGAHLSCSVQRTLPHPPSRLALLGIPSILWGLGCADSRKSALPGAHLAALFLIQQLIETRLCHVTGSGKGSHNEDISLDVGAGRCQAPAMR